MRLKHFLCDVAVVIFILYFSIDLTYLYNMQNLTTNIENTAKLIIPILTFQSALHATSMIFFANSNAELLQNFKDEYILKNGVQTKYKKIDQLYAYFSWAILIQLSFLLYSIFLIIYLNTHELVYFMPYFLILNLYTLVFGVTYSVILCIRNIGLFFSVLVKKVFTNK